MREEKREEDNEKGNMINYLVAQGKPEALFLFLDRAIHALHIWSYRCTLLHPAYEIKPTAQFHLLVKALHGLHPCLLVTTIKCLSLSSLIFLS